MSDFTALTEGHPRVSEPRTAAGRALLTNMLAMRKRIPIAMGDSRDEFTTDILAIEAEALLEGTTERVARSKTDDELRAWYLEIWHDPDYSHPEMDMHRVIERELARRGLPIPKYDEAEEWLRGADRSDPEEHKEGVEAVARAAALDEARAAVLAQEPTGYGVLGGWDYREASAAAIDALRERSGE